MLSDEGYQEFFFLSIKVCKQYGGASVKLFPKFLLKKEAIRAQGKYLLRHCRQVISVFGNYVIKSKITDMSSKRRTFHVDWDSPSHETGTVKRRPASLNTSFSLSNNCFENVEYYELKDHVGGYGLRLLRSFNNGSELQDSVLDLISSRGGSNEVEDGVVEDNNDRLKHRMHGASCEEKPSGEGDSEKLKDLLPDLEFEELSSSDLIGRPNESCSPTLRSYGNSGVKNRGVETVTEDSKEDSNRRTIINEGSKKVEATIIKDYKETESTIIKNHKAHKSRSNTAVKKNIDPPDSKASLKNSKLVKDFGLKLSREPFEWRSKASKIAKVPGGFRKDTVKTSFIPKLKTRKHGSSGRGLVNSSSESSGIGSPLSPLSPLKDASTGVKNASESLIRTSDSKSSGFGSPNSPLSPESQKFTAFYLIEEQLEKLRNCPCEKRQAQVICFILFGFRIWITVKGFWKN